MKMKGKNVWNSGQAAINSSKTCSLNRERSYERVNDGGEIKKQLEWHVKAEGSAY